MGYILDIILSLVIRGAIALAILNMTIALQSKLSEKTAQANMFSLTNTVSRIMGDEMRMVGYNVGSPPYFTVVSKDSIEFTYFSPSGGQHWVKFVLGNTSELSNTSNPNDRRLYRCDGTSGAGSGVRKSVANGFVKMEFKYYDINGNETSTATAIKSFSVRIIMATGEAVNGLYPTGEWTYRFFPANIN